MDHKCHFDLHIFLIQHVTSPELALAAAEDFTTYSSLIRTNVVQRNI